MKAALTTRIVLLMCFILSILFSFSGISIRLENESKNKSIVPVMDYYEILNASKLAKVGFKDVLRRFKEAGVSTAAVDESAFGFEQKDLKYLKDMGFEILLRPGSVVYQGSDYYEGIVKRFNIKYIIFKNSQTFNDFYNTDAFGEIIKKYGLITGIIENPAQTGYMNQKGLTQLIGNTGFAVNRVYIIPDSDLEKISGTEMFYRWLRSIVDRNIRFIYIRPLRNVQLSQNANISETINAAGEFNKFAVSSGFSINKPINILSAKFPEGYHKFAVGFSVEFILLLYIFYLFNPRVKTITVIAFFTSITVIGANIYLGDGLLRLWATIAAILYPSFSSLIFLKYLKSDNQKPLLIQTLSALGILIGINSLGMYTVVTALGDLRFTLGMIVYSGVVISFIVPVVLFVINYYSCFIGFEKLRAGFKSVRSFKITAKGVLIFIIFGFVFYIYIARSGNDMGISATKFELNFRELLEKFLSVRPRFKEFVIGYPSLLLLIYLYKRFIRKEIVLCLGFLVVMGSVSMVNSFCHGFTPVLTSLHRTVNGLVIGVPLGGIIILLVRSFIIFYNKIIGHSFYTDK